MAGGSLEGRLLIATPTLADGVFDRTVVLLIEHDDGGAMGLVLNDPSGTTLDEVMPEWSDVAAPPARVFVGGPVEQSIVFGLGRTRGGRTEGWTEVLDDLGVVDLSRDPVLVAVEVARLRLFVGYAGWAPGQLEGEIEAGAWFAADARPDDAFHPDPGRLYADVLRRQGGELALYATYPPDPRSN